MRDPAHLSNEYFDKFVGWHQRHINLSDHNSKIKYSNLESGARTKICRCWLADHFTQVCRPPTLSCHRRRHHPHHFPNHHHHHHYRHVIIVMTFIVIITLPFHTLLNCYHFMYVLSIFFCMKHKFCHQFPVEKIYFELTIEADNHKWWPREKRQSIQSR